MSFKQDLDQLKLKKTRLNEVFRFLRSKHFRIARLTKTTNSVLETWKEAANKLNAKDYSELLNEDCDVVVCSKISETQSSFSYKIKIHVNHKKHRKMIIDVLEDKDFNVLNKKNKDEAIIVEMVEE